MSPTFDVTPGAVEHALAAIAVVVAVLLVVSLRRRRIAGDGYRADLAWRRAGVYFAGCVVAAWPTGVLTTLLHGPLVRDAGGLFLAWTAVCVAVVLVGYGVVWPRGTLSHGRERTLVGSVGFGLLWGVFESLLLLALFAVAEDLVAASWARVLVAFLLISAWQGGWHAAYWDIHVAPDHNIAAWNLPKVAFAHTPNLVVTLLHLEWFGAPWLFVAFQTLALTLSTWSMRFPAPRATGASPPRSR